ncbi:hypothetical protein BGI27_17645, partial [Candidatus Dactylopiibacterium carminicum]
MRRSLVVAAGAIFCPGHLTLILALAAGAGLWYLLTDLKKRLQSVMERPLAISYSEGSFLSNMEHDLRQPAQAIALFAATLSAHPLPESSRKLVSGIEAAVQQLSAQMEAAFAIAKLESGRQAVDLQPLEPVHSIRNVFTFWNLGV